jgi:PAS domain S-box-containing protein
MDNKPIIDFLGRCFNDTNTLSVFLESMSHGIWISDKKGTAIFANSACCELFGKTHSEFVGKYNVFEDGIIEEQGLLPVIKKAYSEGVNAKIAVNYPVSYLPQEDERNGAPLIIGYTLSSIMDDKGEVENIIFHTSDVSNKVESKKKIQYEESLLRSSNDQKFRLLYQNAPLPYQSLNEGGYFVDINPAWQKALGYKCNEVIGKYFGDFLHPDSLSNFKTNFSVFKKNSTVI